MSSKYSYNNTNKVKQKKRFKCYDCGIRFGEYNQLFKHATKYHKDLIGDEDPDKYLYDKRNPGDHLCTICKTAPAVWESEKRHYSRFCTNPECKKKAREAFRKNMKRIYGTDNLLTDPEHQAAMLQNRSISGTYIFKDGTELSYTGKFELDFIEHCVDKLHLTSMELVSAPPSTYTKYYDYISERERYYIPDFYIPKYNLVIEIKDKSKFPVDSKAKARMKEAAVVKNDKYNYIKIVNKEYDTFDKLMKLLSENDYDELKNSNNEHIIIIPQNTDLL